ncbi:MAG: LuxR C-terminal-related transcriptional regulator [Candidatus Limnocylindria bacterium]
MARPILETKFYAPRARSDLVSRPRLAERVRRGLDAKLTLVSAPAGFGKTTLLSEWLDASSSDDRSVAWLSLDEADNDSASFWTYLTTSLKRATPAAGAALSLLQEPQPPPIETILTALLNGLGQAQDDFVLVLDDYHVVDARDVQEHMAFLLDHLPPRMHLVLATRADPALPLSRMRARGELVEIRAADLRFTADEAAAYLNEMMGLQLTARDVAALEARTEGWIAALQLAALSMQGRDDVAGFIAGFAGDDRFVVDYLVEEVLQRLPNDRRRFLLQTSILDRMNGALCDAVTGQHGGRSTLEALERANLFVIPLDASRQWYRYHHLFADVMRARLLDEEPDLIPDLHRRASEWYEQNGERSQAIRHALAGEDFERAASMIELEIPALRRARQEADMRRWLEALPEDVFRVRPVLSVGYVGALMVNGKLQDVEALLAGAERWLGITTSAEMVVADESELRRLPSAIAMYRAALAQILGDTEATLGHARRALDLAGDDDPVGRGGAAGFLALASWGNGDLEAAHGFWADAMASLLQAGHIVDAVGCRRPLAEIRMAQGRPREAMDTYEQGLRLAAEHGATVLRGAADLHVGMSELLLEWNDLDAAADHLLKSNDLGEKGGLAQNPYRWHVAMARLREAEGEAAGALGLLRESLRLYVSEYFPVVRPIHALTARIYAAQGRLAEATDWVREHGLSVEDDLSYVREYEHITLARVLMARSRHTHDQRSMRDAMALLQRLLEAAEEGRRQRSVIEILMLLALAQHPLGSSSTALVPLGRALALAEPEGYVRTFVSEGAPMAALLTAAAGHGIAPDYARFLLEELGRADGRTSAGQQLMEPLTERELDVIRLLGTELDGPAIARELVVGLSTVRTHTKSIYAKLGVNSRRAAVRRGEELGLLSRATKR